MNIIEMLKDGNYQKHVVDAYELALKVQPNINAVVTFIDPCKQLEEVKDGKLKGIPVALKDNVNTKGIKTTASSKILENYIPVYDATIVKKLKDAGAVIIAKTSMDELAMGGTNLSAATGPVYNPYDVTRISGGSSGGSAAIVASGVVPLAIGSDTGDSIRKPASFCGVVGVKPTYGRISRYGIIPYASSLDHVGYFTRNVKDAALALEVLAGCDPMDATSSQREVPEYSKLINSDITGKKVIVFKNVLNHMNNEETLVLFQRVIDGLKEKGAIVKEVTFNEELMKAILPTYHVIANCEATANHSNLDGIRFGNKQEGSDTFEIMCNTRSQGLSSSIRKRFVIGSYALFEENQEKYLKQAQRVRRMIVEEVASYLKDADVLIAPASNDAAPKMEDVLAKHVEEDLVAENHMVFANFSGYPSMTLPMGYIHQHLPVGVNITANAFKEVDMFSIGSVIEEITGLKDTYMEVK